MNVIIPDIPSSPKLIKSDSMSSISSYNSEEDIIDYILNEIIDDVCDKMYTKKKQIYKYVRIHRQNILYCIINNIYYVLTLLNIIKYKKLYQIKNIFCLIDKQNVKLNMQKIYICDDGVQLNNIKNTI